MTNKFKTQATVTIEKAPMTECYHAVTRRNEPPIYNHLKITSKAYLKLMFYIFLAGDNEIIGFGKIDDGTITDVKILEQYVKSAHGSASDLSMAKFISSIPPDDIPKWTLDWHSHVRMSVSPSITDTDNYREMYKARGFSQYQVMIVNQDEQIYLASCIGGKLKDRIELTIDNTILTEDETLSIYEECKDDFNKYVKVEKTVTTYKSNKYTQQKVYNNSYYGDDYYDQFDKKNYCLNCGVELVGNGLYCSDECRDGYPSKRYY